MNEQEYLELQENIKQYEMYLEWYRELELTAVELAVAQMQDDFETWRLA
jgi:hypothetical protein